jgi:uncharacterized DUF497 family protein
LKWVWDDNKNRSNKRNHGLSFEAARYVFNDPLAISRLDPYPDEERWQTIGRLGELTVFVVHTWLEADPITKEETGRIISARRATNYERRAYEEGNF